MMVAVPYILKILAWYLEGVMLVGYEFLWRALLSVVHCREVPLSDYIIEIEVMSKAE